MNSVRRTLVSAVGLVALTTLALSQGVYGALDKTDLSKDLDGVYTLREIISPTGEISAFSYGNGGELIVQNLKTTFTTSSESVAGEINRENCEIKSWGFIETDLDTNKKFAWLRTE